MVNVRMSLMPLLEGSDNLICILQVCREITGHELEGVVVRCAVEVGSITGIDTCGEGGFEDLEDPVVRGHVVFSGWTCAAVSSCFYPVIDASNAHIARIRPRPFWLIGFPASIGIDNEQPCAYSTERC